MTFWIFLGGIGLLVATMFRPTALLLGRILFMGALLFRLVLVVGLVVGVTSTPVAYDHLGWTPISLLAGDQVYAGLSARADAKLKKGHYGQAP